MMNIAINQPRASYFLGGAELVSINHAKYFLVHGLRVTFITIKPISINKNYSYQYQAFKEEYKKRIKFIELDQIPRSLKYYEIDPGENRDRWNIESLCYCSQLNKYLYKSKKNFDVLLSYYKLDALTIPADKVKLNTLYLCGIPNKPNDMMSSFLSMYDKIIAISQETKNYWQRYSDKTISVVGPGVEYKLFKPATRKNNHIKIVFIGRLIHRKGCDIFINSLSHIKKYTSKKFSVTIAGTGPQEEELKRLVRLKHLDKVVKFVGKIDNPEKLLSEADICVFPSRYGEGVQGVILEAMASGAYVIATYSNTNTKILANKRGIILKSLRPIYLAKSISKVLNNDAILENTSRKSVEYVKRHHDWTKITYNFIEVINNENLSN